MNNHLNSLEFAKSKNYIWKKIINNNLKKEIMKKYAILALATLLTISLSLTAQKPTPPDGRRGHENRFSKEEMPQMSAQKRAGYLAVDLELTDAQRLKVQALFEKQDKIREERKAEVKKLREQELAKFEAERKSQEAELVQIIGTEKFQKLEIQRNEMKKKMKERRFGNQNDSTFHGKKNPRHEIKKAQ